MRGVEDGNVEDEKALDGGKRHRQLVGGHRVHFAKEDS